jgi:hypothetical protein
MADILTQQRAGTYTIPITIISKINEKDQALTDMEFRIPWAFNNELESTGSNPK